MNGIIYEKFNHRRRDKKGTKTERKKRNDKNGRKKEGIVPLLTIKEVG